MSKRKAADEKTLSTFPSLESLEMSVNVSGVDSMEDCWSIRSEIEEEMIFGFLRDESSYV